MGGLHQAKVVGNLTDNPFWNLPLSDSRCMNSSCEAFIIGYNESQRRYPNTLFLHYGFWVVYFYGALIGIFVFLHFKHRLADANKTRRLRERTLGLWRSFTYRRLDGKMGDQVDVSYGILVLLASATVFLCVLPFYQGFFLREEFRFGSPPLSVRCAMIMSALTPIMIVLAGKMNLLTMLTGVSYAKLNIWHRFVGYAVFCLAWVHTIPHLIAPIKEGGMKELTELYQIKRREFSGTFLITDFFLLVVFSLPYFRNKAYEVFKHGHIALALGWFALIFWHIRNEYVAPEFFYSAAGVWACSVIARMVYRNRFMFPLSNITRGFPTTLEYLPGNMTRVVVSVPARMRWKPGQHCYISIPGISSVGNHPFTIASIPHPRYFQGPSELVLLIRECGGFTKMLGQHAKSASKLDLSGMESLPATPTAPGITLQKLNSPASGSVTPPERRSITPAMLSPERNTLRPNVDRKSSGGSLTIPDRLSIAPDRHLSVTSSFGAERKSITPSFLSLDNLESQPEAVAEVSTWVDGPFGEYTRPLHRHYEGFITIAGGSGLTASLPWIMYLTEKMNKASKSPDPHDYDCPMRSVHFIWSIRKAEWICWARRELIRALRAAAESNGRFSAIVYVTSRDANEVVAKAMQLDLMIAAGLSEGIDRSTVEVRYGRPKMDQILPTLLDRKRNMIRVCGPNALKAGVANTVASMQKLVISGQVEGIALDSETFGW